MFKILILISFIALAGCAPVTKIYVLRGSGEIDMDKPDAVIHQTAPGNAKYDDGKVKVEVDTRSLSVYEKYLAPILSSAGRSTRNNVNLD